jgi:hypothetical protein
MMLVFAVLDGGFVAAKPVTQESRNPADRGDADAGHVMNAPIGDILLKQANNLPAIDQRLQFGRRAQVFEKVSAFGGILQADHRIEEGVFVAFSLACGVVSIGFHSFGKLIVRLMY